MIDWLLRKSNENGIDYSYDLKLYNVVYASRNVEKYANKIEIPTTSIRYRNICVIVFVI